MLIKSAKFLLVAAYQAWISEKKSHKEVRESFVREEFRLGVHKAMLIAGDAEDRDVYLVSGIPAQAVRSLLLEPAATVQIYIEMFDFVIRPLSK